MPAYERMTRDQALERLAALKAHLAESRKHYIEHTGECPVCVLDVGPWCRSGLFRHATWCREAGELRHFARQLTHRRLD